MRVAIGKSSKRAWLSRQNRPPFLPYLPESLEPRTLLSTTADPAARTNANQSLQTQIAPFVQNQGQWKDSAIKYAYNGQNIHIGFTNAGPVLELLGSSQRERIHITFDNAQPTTPLGVDQSHTSFNYLVGNASQHRSNVPAYQKVSYPNLYRGIDLLTWAQPGGMKYEFHVAPQADWRNIRVIYAGSGGLRINPDGSLHIVTPLGDLVEQAPLIYQAVNGNRTAVAGKFVLIDSDTYAIAVTGAYDHSQELVIDPNLAWASYLGASGSDIGYGIDLDASGNAYVAGFTDTGGWATAGAYDTSYNISGDVFVAKLSASGSSLLYMTYLGGNGSDVANGIGVDGAGNAYVTGYTQSSGWATTGAYDTSFNGIRDAFVAKLNTSGSSLLYMTYLGGAASDAANAIAVDGAGNAYVTGQTASGGWATAGAYDTAYNGGVVNGNDDIFVAKLNPSGASLLFATYLGGSSPDIGHGIAIDGAGNAYVAGETSSPNWALAGYDTSYNGGIDIFVAKISTSGATLLYATYLGLSGADDGIAIAVDGVGSAYVTGYTQSAEWATPGSYDPGYNVGFDAFVAKLSVSGATLVYATYLGGSGNDRGYAIAVDGVGNAYVTGETSTPSWATVGAYDETYSGGPDPFVAKLSASGAALLYNTYLGGSGDDYGRGIALDGAGNAYVTGNTQSGGGATAGAFDTSYNGGNDAFVIKIGGLVDPFPGDTNGDGKVDFQDLVAVAQNYGGSNKTRAQGDVTGDGIVDFKDLVLVAQNYGKPLATAPVPAALPHPQFSAATPPIVTRPRPSPPPHTFNPRKRINDAIWNA